MKYHFFKKAKEQPDLADFCNYLQEHLETLEEINHKYENLSLAHKSQNNNMMIYLRIDKILNQYLPNMVDNFCSFSFDYRNTEIIKTEKTKDGENHYTAKELLLLNLSKLIQEIKEIEKDFNEQNKFGLLVQNKLMTNLGYEFDLEQTNPTPKLKNNFNYQVFKKNKTTKVIVTKEPNKKTEKAPISLNSSDNSENSRFLVDMFLFVGLLVLMITIALYMFSHVAKQNIQDFTPILDEISLVNKNIVNRYAKEEDYNSLDVNKMIEEGYLPQRLSSSVSHNILIKNKLVKVEPIINEKSYIYTINNINKEQCEILKIKSGAVAHMCDAKKNQMQLIFKN